jgi:two-component system response regulator YesN
MKNYTIIIVDDEEEVKRRIVSKIPLDFGFEIVGLASNGYDALEMIDKLRPDVIITDIKMPFIDGIQLSRIIRSEYPKTKIAFITGYDEFTYAKEAIELDVLSYLSKPITETDILNLLTKLKSRLDDEFQQVFNQEKLDKIYQDSLPALIENQFSTLLQLPVLNDLDLDRFKVFDIDLHQGHFLLGIIEINHEGEFIKIELLRIFLLNLLRRKLSSYQHLYCFNSGFSLVFIINDSHISEENLEAYLYDIVLTKKEFSDIKIKIGVSEVFDDFKMFPSTVIQAKEAIAYSNYLNAGTIIHYKDIISQRNQTMLTNNVEANHNRMIKPEIFHDRSDDIMEETVAFINANYQNPSINLNELCASLGVSVSYLSTLFKRLLKTSFSKYLVKVRMEKAQELLRFSTLKIYEISNTVGYNDIYYFSYSFKKYTGLSPKEYRHDKKV